MSADFIQIISTFFGAIWSLFTSFKIPGLNFSPAVLAFGILSFNLAIKLIHGILTITTSGVSDKVVKASYTKDKDGD